MLDRHAPIHMVRNSGYSNALKVRLSKRAGFLRGLFGQMHHSNETRRDRSVIQLRQIIPDKDCIRQGKVAVRATLTRVKWWAHH
jgi:hypothetical protein